MSESPFSVKPDLHLASLHRVIYALEAARSANDIVEVIQREIETMLGYSGTWIYTITPDKRWIDLLASRVGDHEDKRERTQRYPIEGDPYVEELVYQKKTIVIEEASLDPRTDKQVVDQLKIRSLIGIPVLLEHEPLAVITTGTFGDEGPRIPSSDQLRYFEALAKHTAVVLDRIRFFEEREQSALALKESETRYRELFEESPEPVFISSLDGRLLEINSAAQELFAYPSKLDLLGVDIESELYLCPSDREEYIKEICSEGFVKDFELRLKRKDGTEIRVLECATLRRDYEGKVIGFRGFLRDITKRRGLEQQLVQAQKWKRWDLLPVALRMISTIC